MERAEILAQAGRWADDDGIAALATVIETWGSAPRAAGSLLAVSRRGGFVGSVSGGCVERAVIEAAQEAIDDGSHRILSFGVTDTEAWAQGLACGGRIRVLVEPVVRTADFTEWEQAVGAGRAVLRETDLETGRHALRYPADGEAAVIPAGDRARLSEDGRLFLNPFGPPLRLVLVGAVHIAEPLARMAAIAGYAVTVVEGRRAFARADLFPQASLRGGWPADILPELALDRGSAVVALTHDPKFDDGALAVALTSPAFYIGALGSRKTHARRLARLAVAGFDQTALARIHGPVGLDLGADTPGQIAVAILAQMTAVLHGRQS